MKLNLILVCLFFTFIVKLSYSQKNFTLSGTVTDKNNNETLIGGNVFIKEIKTTLATNEYGFYSVTLPEGEYTVEISYTGYDTVTNNVLLRQNTKQNFSLTPSQKVLDEVVINVGGTPPIDLQKAEMSVHTVSATAVKRMPVVFGEPDAIRTLLQLPGVTNAGEASSGFYVRGGAVDQNLILLDEAIIFNPSHLLGFFSVFNPDIIKNMKLYKGGIPSRYGGRGSSVLEVHQREGNSNKFHGNGGIGLISSRLLLEGPLVKDKSSFLIAGRTSYVDLLLKAITNDFMVNFYDLNMKFNYKFNDNNSLYVSSYFGKDKVKLGDVFDNIYGNTTATLRWNHLFSDKLFSNASLIYSDYFNDVVINNTSLKWDFNVKNYNLKYDFKHYISNDFKLSYGANIINYVLNPGEISASTPDSDINHTKLALQRALEPALYMEAEQTLFDKLSVMYGIRYSAFYTQGKQNIYDNNQPVLFDRQLQIYERAIPIGTQETVARYNNFEPRLTIGYQLDEKQAVKVNYNRMSQYVHLISNNNAPMSLDIWSLSSNFIKPLLVDQYAGGYFRNFKNEEYSLEIETYYKTMANVIDYIDGANLIANEAIERELLNGEGRAYGLEFLVRKNRGRLNGFIAYTISRTEQRTPGRTPYETGINNGNWYKTASDRLHDLTITGNYQYNPKWLFSANFSLQSGRPVTFPNGQYELVVPNLNNLQNNYLDLRVTGFNARNENRLPVYHHLDISATYVPKPNKKTGWQGEWVFGIYNIYNRKNLAAITFGRTISNGPNEVIGLSIFGMVPSITYNFKF